MQTFCLSSLKHCLYMVLSLLFALLLSCQSGTSIQITLNCQGRSSEIMEKFWTNTGLSPPGPGEVARQFLTSPDVRTNLLIIGSLPFNSITHVRIHWLLDLISLESAGESSISSMKFNFSLLDRVLNFLTEAQLSPGFEVMGTPQPASVNYSKKYWHNLLAIILKRYIKKLGRDKVEQWRIETWNEPDLKMYNILNFTASDYLEYFNGVQSAVRSFNLSIGGPAGLFKSLKTHKLCWSFLNHCNSDPSLCNLAFISFHKKGNSDVKGVIQGTKILLNSVSENYSRLKSIPFANSESDFLTGWWRNESWRADVRYAAAVAESIMLHKKFFKKTGFQLLFISHDNGFLNYYPHFFTQRTLLSRFQMNNTEPLHSQFFCKPALNVMILLALLEDGKIPVKQPKQKKLKILATRSLNSKSASTRIAVLLVLNDAMKTGPKTELQISLLLPKMKEPRYNVLMLDNSLPSPSSVWEEAGSPDFPDKLLRNEMRLSQNLHRAEFGIASAQKLNISLQLSLPSVALIHICSGPINSPGKVTNVRFLNVTFNEVIIFWSDKGVNARCLKTFEVYFSRNDRLECGNFTRINLQDSLLLSYQYSPLISGPTSESVEGSYKVRAVDYWDNRGPFSDLKEY